MEIEINDYYKNNYDLISSNLTNDYLQSAENQYIYYKMYQI